MYEISLRQSLTRSARSFGELAHIALPAWGLLPGRPIHESGLATSSLFGLCCFMIPNRSLRPSRLFMPFGGMRMPPE